jgi:bifunctional non-homologous end joining protein LigD
MASIIRPTPTLPAFIRPMLAKPGVPFDSAEHLFEVKWDGTRMLAFIDGSGYGLINRWRAVRTAIYPELSLLAELPAGTVLDGEVVVLRDGKPDFRQLLARENSRSDRRIRAGVRTYPVTYIAFDLLYQGFESLTHLELRERRARLAASLARCQDDRLALSQGVVGMGKAYFAEVCRLGLEGIVAKRLDSRKCFPLFRAPAGNQMTIDRFLTRQPLDRLVYLLRFQPEHLHFCCAPQDALCAFRQAFADLGRCRDR